MSPVVLVVLVTAVTVVGGFVLHRAVWRILKDDPKPKD